MVGFCSVQDVIDKTGSKLDNPTLTNLVESGARKIRTRLKRENLSTAPVPTPDELIEANAHFSSALALMRAMTDGKLPASQNISGASASVDVPTAIANHNAEGERYLQEYINSAGESYRPFRVVGELGERVGEYDTMTTEQEEDD